MFKKIIRTFAMALLIPLAFSSAANADAIYMQVSDANVKGESKVRGYENWIVLNSVTFQMGRSEGSPATGAGRGAASKISFKDIQIQKYMDLSSTSLLTLAASGKPMKSVVIDIVSDTGEDDIVVAKYTLSEVLVSSYSQFQASGDDLDARTETIGLNYAKINIEYTSILPNGKAGTKGRFGWDIAANRAV